MADQASKPRQIKDDLWRAFMAQYQKRRAKKRKAAES